MTDGLLATFPRTHHDGGLLGQALVRRSGAMARPRSEVPLLSDVRLLAADTPDAAATRAPELAAAGGPFLLVVAELDRVVIGPLVRPGTPGCHRCLAARRAGARDDAAEEAALHATYGNRLTGTVSPCSPRSPPTSPRNSP